MKNYYTDKNSSLFCCSVSDGERKSW